MRTFFKLLLVVALIGGGGFAGLQVLGGPVGVLVGAGAGLFLCLLFAFPRVILGLALMAAVLVSLKLLIEGGGVDVDRLRADISRLIEDVLRGSSIPGEPPTPPPATPPASGSSRPPRDQDLINHLYGDLKGKQYREEGFVRTCTAFDLSNPRTGCRRVGDSYRTDGRWVPCPDPPPPHSNAWRVHQLNSQTWQVSNPFGQWIMQAIPDGYSIKPQQPRC